MSRVDDGFERIEQGNGFSLHARAYGETCVWPDCEARCMVVRPDGLPVLSSRAEELVLRNGWVMLAPARWLCPEHAEFAASVTQARACEFQQGHAAWVARLRGRAVLEQCMSGNVEKSGLTPE